MSNRIITPSNLNLSDLFCQNINIPRNLLIPRYDTLPGIQKEGSLVFLTTDDNVYSSDGVNWNIVGAASSSALLQDIADLSPLVADKIIYTQATDNFTSSTITSVARTFLEQTSIASQQAILDLTPGTEVQIQNATLQGIADTNPVVGDRMLYTTTTNNFSATAVDTFGLSFLDTLSASVGRTSLDVVQRAPSSSVNELALHDGSEGLLNTGITIISNDIAGALNDVTATGVITSASVDTVAISNSSGDLTVEGTSIPVAKWPFLSTMQDVSTTATPAFTGLSATSTVITAVATPVSATDAANKSYVDSAVAGLSNPFASAVTATTAQLTVASEAGAGVGKTISGSIANIGTIDGILLSLNDQVLVKNGTSVTAGSGDPNNSTSNGIYIATQVAVSIILTRSTDADQPSELSTGRSVFIETGATVNGGTTWQITSDTPTTVDTDPIQFSQTGAAQNLTAGDGIGIVGSVISADINTTAFVFSSGEIDTVAGGLPISKGGTAATSFTAGDRIVSTNTGNTALEATSLDPSIVTTTTNTQTFTNKTFAPAVSSNVLTLDGINFSTAGATTAGNVLTITGGVARWDAVPEATVALEREVSVAQSGGDYTSIQAALVDINAGTITGGVPSATNWAAIRVYPGTFTETNPIIVPEYVIIKGSTSARQIIITVTSATDDIFQLGPNCVVENLEARGNTTGDGFNISWAPGAGNLIPKIQNCFVRNCGRGFHSQGTGATNSSVVLLRNCDVNVDASSTQTMTECFRVSASGVMIGNILNILGDAASPTSITQAYEATGTGSLAILSDIRATLVSNGFSSDSGAEMRVVGAELLNFVTSGINLGPDGSIGRFTSVYIQDNSSVFVNQIHLVIQSGATLLQGAALILRVDLVQIAGNASIEGYALNTEPGEAANQFLGELTVGVPALGFQSHFGEGDSHTFGTTIFTFDASGAGFSANLVSDLKLVGDGNSVTIFPSNTVGDIFYIGGDPTNGIFPGIDIVVTTAVVPAGGRLNGTTEPPTYHYAWEYWDGTAWTEFRIMTVNETTHKSSRRDSFDLGTFHLRFGHIGNTKDPIPSAATFGSANTLAQRWVTSGTAAGNWTENTVNSVSAFWARARLTTVLTTVPILDQVKLQTNHFEITAEGYTEYFGSARNIKRITTSMLDFRRAANDNSTNQDIYISDTLNLNTQHNRFANNTVATITYVHRIPTEIDTSHGIILQWAWASTSTNTGNVRWIIRWGYSTDFGINSGDVSQVFDGGSPPSEALTEQRITFDQPAIGINRQVSSFCRIDMSDLVGSRTLEGDGDIMWISLARDGRNDTATGVMYLICISIQGYICADGQIAL